MSKGGSQASLNTFVSFCPFCWILSGPPVLYPCFLCSCFPESHPRQSVAGLPCASSVFPT